MDDHFKNVPGGCGCVGILLILLAWIVLVAILLNVPRYNKDSEKQVQDDNQQTVAVCNCNCGNNKDFKIQKKSRRVSSDDL